jgi:hypothetical protein
MHTISCSASIFYVKMSGMTSNISTVAIFMIAMYSCGNITCIFLSLWSVYTEGPLKVTQWLLVIVIKPEAKKRFRTACMIRVLYTLRKISRRYVYSSKMKFKDVTLSWPQCWNY